MRGVLIFMMEFSNIDTVFVFLLNLINSIYSDGGSGREWIFKNNMSIHCAQF